MMEESAYSDLGKQLAEIGLSFAQVRDRMMHMSDEKKYGILKGFALATLISRPDDSYRAAFECKEETIARSAAKKLLETNLRVAGRVAVETQDEWLLELVIQEADRRGEAAMVDHTKRELRELKLRRIKEEFGI